MTLLLLAGTQEAKAIARQLAGQGADVLASLAGATARPMPLPVPTRVGGFGGAEGFRAVIRDKGITAVLDATHPFAARITTRTAQICADIGLPYCHYLRPPWQPGPGDDWQFIDHASQAAPLIPTEATVLLATGRKTVPDFSGLAPRAVHARVVDPQPEPFPFVGGSYLVDRPPFSEQAERDLFRQLGITHLIAKNAGGSAGRAKLTVARDMGLPVILMNRPIMPAAHRVNTVDAAVAWARACG